jgi:hypothetical protein
LKKAIDPSNARPITGRGSATAALASALLFAATAASAAPATPGADFTERVILGGLDKNQVVVTSVTLDLPGPGVVVVNSGGYVIFSEEFSSGVVCSITKETDHSQDPLFVAQGDPDTNARRIPLGSTRGFREKEGGPQTYNLVCAATTAKTTVTLRDILLTAIYVPKRY